MSFQSLIFDKIKNILTEAPSGNAYQNTVDSATAPTPSAPRFQKTKGAAYGAGGTILAGSTYLGYKHLQQKPRLNFIGNPNSAVSVSTANPIYNPDAAQAAGQTTQAAGQTAQAAGVTPGSVADKTAAAMKSLSTAGAGVKDAVKSGLGHAADFVATNPGTALGIGAAGIAAWLARRRALKNASRGL